jgi:hypothetical protein
MGGYQWIDCEVSEHRDKAAKSMRRRNSSLWGRHTGRAGRAYGHPCVCRARFNPAASVRMAGVRGAAFTAVPGFAIPPSARFSPKWQDKQPQAGQHSPLLVHFAADQRLCLTGSGASRAEGTCFPQDDPRGAIK